MKILLGFLSCLCIVSSFVTKTKISVIKTKLALDKVSLPEPVETILQVIRMLTNGVANMGSTFPLTLYILYKNEKTSPNMICL